MSFNYHNLEIWSENPFLFLNGYVSPYFHQVMDQNVQYWCLYFQTYFLDMCFQINISPLETKLLLFKPKIVPWNKYKIILKVCTDYNCEWVPRAIPQKYVPVFYDNIKYHLLILCE